MARYTATFEMPALVRVQIELDADNQQDGIIAAHDLVLGVTPGQARIVKLDAQAATNVSFERLEQPDATNAVPPNPLEIAGLYRVEFRAGASVKDSPVAVRTVNQLAYGNAKALAESVLAADSVYGSAQVFDQFNNKVLEVKSPMGGFVVEVRYNAALLETERFPWIASAKEAKATAVGLLSSRQGYECVRIYDFTVRSAGMQLVREIR